MKQKRFADRVFETSTTQGTGPLTLAGAVTGARAFSEAFADNAKVYYAITVPSDRAFETGLGTYLAATNQLRRDIIYQSSANDAAVDWGAGTRNVFCTPPGGALPTLDETLTEAAIGKPLALTSSGGLTALTGAFPAPDGLILGTASIGGVATQQQAEAGTAANVVMTPERTKQAIDALFPNSRITAIENDVTIAKADIDVLSANIGILALRQQIDTGWSVLKMVDGVADEFEDESGIFLNWSADQATGGTVFANGSFTTFTPDKAFDDNVSTFWASSLAVSQSAGAGYIGYQLPSAKAIRRLVVTHGNSPASIKVQYSDNGSSWTDVTTYAATSASNMAIDLPDVGSHLYWRLLSNSNTPMAGSDGASSWGMHEIEMLTLTGSGGSSGQTYDAVNDYYHNPDKANMTLISQSFSAMAQPSKARALLIHQAVDAVAINTDCTLEISRNNGTDWVAATLVNEGAFDNAASILSAMIDLSAQPSGSALRWRFKTLNSKEQRLHGIYLQWSA